MANEPTPTSKWIARVGDDRIELDDLEALRDLARNGRLRSEHYVFNPTLQQWSYAGEIAALTEALANAKAAPEAWVVQLAGRNHTLADVAMARQWILAGRITRATLIRNPVLQKWMRAGDVLELADAFDGDSIHPALPPDPVSSGSGRNVIIAVSAIVLLAIAAIALLSQRRSDPATSAKTGDLPGPTTATPGQPRPIPRIHTFTFESKKDEAKETAAEAKTTTTTTAAADPAAKAETAPPSTTVEQVAERPVRRPARDDAEEELYDDGEVVFQPNGAIRAQVSGDTPVLIDRSQRDRHYHLSSGCRTTKGEMTTVSLDLARQNYSPCPVCRPPS